MGAMYTASERVVRDGYLVAFAGEVMAEDEAIRRGLLTQPEPETEPEPEPEPVEIPADDELDAMGVSELRALAEAAGLGLAKNAGKAKLLEALKAAR